MRRFRMLATVALLMTAMLTVLAGTAAAHPHFVSRLTGRDMAARTEGGARAATIPALLL